MAKAKVGDSEFDTLTEAEARKLVGEELDSRFSKLEIPKTLDVDALKKDILGEVGGLFEKHKSTPLDEDKFTKKIESMFDEKLTKALKGFGGGNPKPREPGWLSRILTS